MKRARTLPGGVTVRLTDREYQLVLLVALGAGRSTEALARRSGVTPAYVRELLAALPSVAAQESTGAWSLLRPYGTSITRELAEAELRDVTKRLARVGRVTPGKGGAALVALADAESALAVFDIGAALRVIKAAGLNARNLLPLVPPRERAEARGRLARLRVDVLMQAGLGRDAVREARQVLAKAEGQLPEHEVRLWVNRAAAEGLSGIAGAPAALDSYHAALEAIRRLPFDEARRRALLRWTYTARATPLTILGRFEDADRTLGLAEEFLDSSQLDVVDATSEVLLYRARLAVATGEVTAARDFVTRAETLLPTAARWVRGWFPRYAADAVAGGLIGGGIRTGSEERRRAILLLLGGWSATSGFGYQRRVALARLAMLGANPNDAEYGGHPAWSSIRADIARLHREQHRRRPSECETCKMATFREAALHALALRGDEPSWGLARKNGFSVG